MEINLPALWRTVGMFFSNVSEKFSVSNKNQFEFRFLLFIQFIKISSMKKTKQTTEIFIIEIYSKSDRKIIQQIKQLIRVLMTFGVWITDLLDLNDYDPKNNIVHRNFSVVLNKLRKYRRIVRFKNKTGRIIRDSFEKIVTYSERKPNLIETDDGKILCEKNFQ